ncbi:MAG: response regulator [Spirochaetales bacterium]|nr:response regulator [Spirochaetales bacterium]
MCSKLGRERVVRQGKKVRIFSALEVANICGVVNQTAINWIKNKHLKAFTTPGGQYRVYAEDLHAFLAERGMRIPEEIEEITAAGSKYLLIVEDEENLNNMLAELFKRSVPGYEIIQALDGFEAGKLISDKKPSIIILDMSLPGIDGHELIRRITSDDSLNNPRIIAMSGVSAEIGAKDKILSEGAELFLPKPVNNADLVEAVNALIENRSTRGK